MGSYNGLSVQPFNLYANLSKDIAFLAFLGFNSRSKITYTANSSLICHQLDA